MPSFRSTPLSEFNRSQSLLSLAFPTLYPHGEAEFCHPRLRDVSYAEYIEHFLNYRVAVSRAILDFDMLLLIVLCVSMSIHMFQPMGIACHASVSLLNKQLEY